MKKSKAIAAVPAPSPAENIAETAAKSDAKRAAKSQAHGRRTELRRSSSRGRQPDRDQRGSHAKRLVGNLRRNETAMALLARCGLTLDTLSAVGLGVKESYRRTDGTMVAGVLAFPATSNRGRARYGYVNLPGFTENAEHPLAWGPGEAEPLAYGTGETLLICASAMEAWLAWQAAGTLGVAITAVASTQPDVAPAAWRSKRFWSGWTRLIATSTTSRALVSTIVEVSGSAVERCPSAPSPEQDVAVSTDELGDWIIAVDKGDHNIVDPQHHVEQIPGDYDANRVCVHGGLHRGRMYYAFAVERRERDPRSSTFVYSYKTLVARSDGAVLEMTLLPSPPGTPVDRRVHALGDGTRVASSVAMPATTSWSLPSLKSFVERTRDGRAYDGPTGGELHVQLERHLRSRVWLPEDDAYGRVACFVMATYFYRLFPAFPILYIGGPKGSGKSELTAAVVSASFNGTLMSQGSAAALVRLARDGGGLVAIDDAETLNAGFGELSQVLKTGYKAITACKRMVNSSGSTETVDFYGPRVLCNTRGLDEILLSRCLTIRTAQLPTGARLDPEAEADLPLWRDSMHEFAMSHVADLCRVVDELKISARGRETEIDMPLRVVHRLVGEM